MQQISWMPSLQDLIAWLQDLTSQSKLECSFKKFWNDPNWVELRTWKISDLQDWLAYIHQDFLDLQNRILSVCRDSYLIALSINELTYSNTRGTEQGKFYEKVDWRVIYIPPVNCKVYVGHKQQETENFRLETHRTKSQLIVPLRKCTELIFLHTKSQHHI